MDACHKYGDDFPLTYCRYSDSLIGCSPSLEWDRFKGDGAGLVQSKLARIEAILDEFEAKEVSRLLEGEHPEMKKKLKALRREVEALQK